ncbi:MAG TPA: LacI family DNA-binding transcriptional regulator [Verrucomicrobiae bacterium]|nr:LacI family DNA-binding transcriptional regulator [Verrucomicrobiae bacterium]
MVRLKDIAALAQVSIMTVSKALRDAPDISTSTKTRIRSLAEQMGYMPDSVAVGLRNKTSKLFGLVISAVTNPVYARMVMAIEERSHELGYDVILGQTLNMPEREHQVIRRMLSRRVDGLFITPVYRLDPVAPAYEELQRRGTPVVLMGQRAPFCEQFANVETDDVSASITATNHLIELGHRRIAYFAGPTGAPSSQERLEGYRRALRDAGIEPDDRLVFNAGTTMEEGEKAALQMLNESPGATAVQTVNDLVAIGAATVFLGQGLRIPQDLSLVGFGNILVSEHFRVPLTTIRQPKFRLGVAAMESMLKLLKGQRPPLKRLPAEMVIRQSTAPPGRTEASGI